MNNAIVMAGQCLFDIAVQHLGSAEGAFAIAMLNGLSVTQRLPAGSVLRLPEVRDRRIRKVYADRGYEPAVGPSGATPQGIGYWTIGENFTVS